MGTADGTGCGLYKLFCTASELPHDFRSGLLLFWTLVADVVVVHWVLVHGQGPEEFAIIF